MFIFNPEIKRQIKIYILVSILFIGISCFLYKKHVVFIIIVCVVFLLLHFINTYKRYRKIRSLSEDINKVLHGNTKVNFSCYSEGELDILRCDIVKMTTMLNEQAATLVRDKVQLSDMIANISHQIKTPLTSLNIIISIMGKKNLDDSKRFELVGQFENLFDRIDWLITTLLKISRFDAKTIIMKKDVVKIKSLVGSSIEPLRIPAELKGIEIRINSHGNECFTGDLKWTSEAIGNIVKNCIEHTDTGGVVEIEYNENLVYTEIVIKDNGAGFDNDDLPHIFERFYKGKDSTDKSFGIGLALCQMIIKSQNGTIKAENRRLGGAKFVIRFYKGTL